MNDNQSEFLELINTHQGIIRKICFIYCNSEEDREDFSQEIILQLWKSFDSFKGDSAFSTWMYRVSLNTALSSMKLYQQRNEKEGIALQNMQLKIDEKQDISEDTKLLYIAIKKLESIEKSIVLLWLEEKSYKDISEILGITEKNVSVKLVRIKKKMSKIIAEISEE